MVNFLRTSDGRLLLVGGRFLTTGGATAEPPAGGSGTLSLTLDDFKTGHTGAEPVIQRRAGTDFGTVPVLFSYTGTVPLNVQARVVSADGGAVVKDWTSLTGVSANETTLTGLGELPLVPLGADYLLQIRDGNNTATASNGSKRWGVGVCIALMGQSNMAGTTEAGSYTNIVPGTSQTELDHFLGTALAGSYFGSSGFVMPTSSPGTGSTSSGSAIGLAAGGSLAFLRIAGQALKTKYGKRVPVCMIPWAFSNNSIGTFLPGGTNYAKLFGGSGTAAGSIGFASPRNYWAGDFEGVMWHQGEANSSSTRAAYLADLKSLYQGFLDYVAPFGRTAQDLFFAPAVLGVYGNLPNIENIRGAVLDLDAFARANNWPNVRAGWNCIDLDTVEGSDGLHFVNISGGNQYRTWSHRRMMQSVLYMLDCATFNGHGPRLTTATRSGDVATVTVSHEGGTALAARNSGVALTGWLANTAADFTGTDIAVTAAIASANTISVTFPGGTTYPAYLKYMGGRIGNVNSYHPDVTNPVYDNAQYPTGCTGTDLHTGLPLLPTPDAIEVA